ncbi:hypothetical protein AXG93_1538s1000 [Marchantia polymorpha subsp. ruderalis]|uniref:Secretory carrier-associated membrane protein n=1 Tax=Marchantia polymorpha subsp. ruderalis TaxID=1480154 RepID=A0A176WP73_MARPO|nr:hypothetical protein AXG93_1538s1000 [Marchantia polymorpha subsp. ruderalis]
MAGGYDSNPFDVQDDEVNPLSVRLLQQNSVPQANSRGLSPLRPEPLNASDATVDIPGAKELKIKERELKQRELKIKERELKLREDELRMNEQELKRLEEAAARDGILIEDKNWPPFLPILHHDIPRDIPLHLQRIQYFAYASWLGIILRICFPCFLSAINSQVHSMLLCLTWNFIAVTVAWIKGSLTITDPYDDLQIWVRAFGYFIYGVFGSYFFWYRPVYRAMSYQIPETLSRTSCTETLSEPSPANRTPRVINVWPNFTRTGYGLLEAGNSRGTKASLRARGGERADQSDTFDQRVRVQRRLLWLYRVNSSEMA